jgi:hypothetical protein
MACSPLDGPCFGASSHWLRTHKLFMRSLPAYRHCIGVLCTVQVSNNFRLGFPSALECDMLTRPSSFKFEPNTSGISRQSHQQHRESNYSNLHCSPRYKPISYTDYFNYTTTHQSGRFFVISFSFSKGVLDAVSQKRRQVRCSGSVLQFKR